MDINKKLGRVKTWPQTSITPAVLIEQGDYVSDLSCVGGCGFELVEELDTIALSLASAQPAEIGLELLSHPALSADQLREFR